MARHRDAAATRGVSRGPIVALVVVLVLGLLTVGWFKLRADVGAQSAQAAAACVGGSSTLTVVAESDIAGPLTVAAQRYTAAARVIRDQCITVSVRATDSAQVLTALRQGWDPASLGPPPAAWVAPDSTTVARLRAGAADQIDGDPTSLVVSPMVLAVARDAGPAVTAAGLSWAQLPALQRAGDGWSRYGHPDWGAFTAALPTGSAGPTAAPQAAQAVVAGLTGGAAPTAASLTAAGVRGALTALGAGPPLQPASTAAALAAISSLPTVPGSPYQAVPASEQQVFAAARAAPGSISAAQLGGTAPRQDYPYVQLKGASVDTTQSRAAAAFREFLMTSDQQQLFTDVGFRTAAGRAPVPSAAVEFGAVPAALPVTDPVVADTITTALTTPLVQARSTVLLDVSGSMGVSEGGSTRLAASTAAILRRARALPDAGSLGLWTFSADLAGPLPYKMDVPTAALGAAQRAALDAALPALQPRTATSLYASIAAAYRDAVRTYAPTGPNSVLLITDGPNDDVATTLNGVLGTIAASKNPAAPVMVNVIALGSADVAALGQITSATGGQLRNVGGAGSPAMATALTDLLP